MSAILSSFCFFLITRLGFATVTGPDFVLVDCCVTFAALLFYAGALMASAYSWAIAQKIFKPKDLDATVEAIGINLGLTILMLSIPAMILRLMVATLPTVLVINNAFAATCVATAVLVFQTFSSYRQWQKHEQGKRK
jgi:uncharacterized membrane protein